METEDTMGTMYPRHSSTDAHMNSENVAACIGPVQAQVRWVLAPRGGSGQHFLSITKKLSLIAKVKLVFSNEVSLGRQGMELNGWGGGEDVRADEGREIDHNILYKKTLLKMSSQLTAQKHHQLTKSTVPVLHYGPLLMKVSPGLSVEFPLGSGLAVRESKQSEAHAASSEWEILHLIQES